MNLEKPKIKIKKRNNKLIFIDNDSGKILTNAESENYIIEAFFNYCLEEDQEEPEKILSFQSQEIIRQNIINWKMKKQKERREEEEWKKLLKNKNNFEIIVFIFLCHLVEIVLLISLFHI